MSQVLGKPALELSIQPDRGRVVIAATGEIDVATVGELDAAVSTLRADGWRDIVLDLRPLEFLDSTGLAWLVSADRDARANDWRLSLVDGSRPVGRLLDVTGLRHRFKWAAGL